MTTLDLKQTQISSAIDLFSKGEINQALDAVQDLLKDYPNEPVLFNIKGACYADLGQLDVAITNYKEAITIKPDYAKAHFNLAGSLHDLGQLETAVQSYQKAIEIDASYAEAYNNLGNVYQELKQVDSAVQNYKRALEIKPDYVAAQYSLGNTFMELGQLEEAVKSYKAALKLKPEFAEPYYNLGAVLQDLELLDDSVVSYKAAIVLQPDYADAYYNLGILYHNIGQLELAIKSLERAINIKPENAEAHKYLGNTFQANGQVDEAIKCYEKAISIKPDHADAHRNLSNVKKYTQGDEQFILMKELLTADSLDQSNQIHLCFALAKAYEDLEMQDELFEVLHEGNRLRKEQLNYSLDLDLNEHLNLRNLHNLTPYVTEKLILQKPSKIRPIFVVGMPRSGTSLVEQIISSHQEVYGGGELNTLNKLIFPMVNEFSVKKTHVSEKTILSIRKDYLNYLSSLNTPESIITDKMPTNFRYIGFILKAFPEAKIVNLKRDSRAICWSIYQRYFPGKGLGFGFNMKDLAGYYNSYNELMSFWHQEFPGKIYDICYEELTKKQEKETKKLLEYCELKWDDNCLNFHTNKRTVRTTSSLQVRKKMYQGSSQAWKKHEAYLQPLIKNLNSY